MALIAIGRKKKDDDPPAREVVDSASVKPDEIFVTAAAARRVKEKSAEEGVPGGVLRIAVKGGGCSGLSYHFTYVEAPKDVDHIFTRDDARVCVDPKSLKVLGGTILEWDQALGKSGFVLMNPHAKSTCSCGSSFSVL